MHQTYHLTCNFTTFELVPAISGPRCKQKEEKRTSIHPCYLSPTSRLLFYQAPPVTLTLKSSVSLLPLCLPPPPLNLIIKTAQSLEAKTQITFPSSAHRWQAGVNTSGAVPAVSGGDFGCGQHHLMSPAESSNAPTMLQP